MWHKGVLKTVPYNALPRDEGTIASNTAPVRFNLYVSKLKSSSFTL